MQTAARNLSLVVVLVAAAAPSLPAAAGPAHTWRVPRDVVSNPPVTGPRRVVGMAVLRSANSSLNRSVTIGERASLRGNRASQLSQRAAGTTGVRRLALNAASRALRVGELAGLLRATIIGRRSERNAERASKLLNDPSIVAWPTP